MPTRYLGQAGRRATLVLCLAACDNSESTENGADASSGGSHPHQDDAGQDASTGGVPGSGGSNHGGSSGHVGHAGSSGAGGSSGGAGSGGSSHSDASTACNEPTPSCSSQNGETCCIYCDCMMERCAESFATRQACLDHCTALDEDKFCLRYAYCTLVQNGDHCDHAFGG